MLREEMPFSSYSSSDLIILGLDLSYMKEQMLPEIIEKISSSDSQSNFRIEVISSKNPDEVIFFSDLPKRTSNSDKQSGLTGRADVAVDFFKLRSPWYSLPNQGQSKINSEVAQAGAPGVAPARCVSPRRAPASRE